MRIEIGSAAALLAFALSQTAAIAGDNPTTKPLDPSALADISAGTNSVTTTNQAVDATNDGSTITAGQVTSGTVSFASGAFSGFSGVGNVVVNTGNNNNIQGTMSVTVLAAPPA